MIRFLSYILLFILTFFISISDAYAGFVGSYCTYGEAFDALPSNSYAVGDCSVYAPDCYGCVNRRTGQDSDGNWLCDYAYYATGADGCPPCDDDNNCFWSFEAEAAGPGSLSPESGSGSCIETQTITVIPQDENVTWKILSCSGGSCSKGDNEITVSCSVPNANVFVSVLFESPSLDPDDPNNPCNKDSDGDGIKDYLDVEDGSSGAAVYYEITRLDKLVDGGSAPSKTQYAEYLVVYDNGSKSAILKIGDPNYDLTAQYNEVHCNPYTSDCQQYTAGQMESNYPCDAYNGQYQIEYPPQNSEPGEVHQDGDIPGDDSGLSDNALLEKIANNTGKTVENTAEIAKINGNIDSKLKSVDSQLTAVNKNLQGIAGALTNSTERNYGDPKPIEEGDLPDYFTDDNPDLQVLYDDSVESYKDKLSDIDDKIDNFKNDFYSHYSLSLSSPSCSIDFVVLDNPVSFNFCPYADTVRFIGRVFRFIVQVSLVIMIFKV